MVTLTATNPQNKRQEHVPHDNGTNGDLKARNGICIATVTGIKEPGNYKFIMRSMGKNQGGELVPRYASRYTSVPFSKIRKTRKLRQSLPLNPLWFH